MATRKVKYVGPSDEVEIHDPVTGEKVASVERGHQVELPTQVARSLGGDFEPVKDAARPKAAKKAAAPRAEDPPEPEPESDEADPSAVTEE